MAIAEIETAQEVIYDIEQITGIDETKPSGTSKQVMKSAILKELEQYEYRLEDNIDRAVVALIRDDRDMPDDPIVMSFVERILKDALEVLFAAQHKHFKSIIKKVLLEI